VAQFEEWPSTARLFRDVVITEKLDGTNACVIFEWIDDIDAPAIDDWKPFGSIRVVREGSARYAVYAQSRKRLITPSNDNAGFAKWVEKNADRLFHVLGPGRHYGEWWGQGIGRKYDMDRKVFSTFNTAAWFREEYNGEEDLTSRAMRAKYAGIDVDCVPILDTFTFSEDRIRDVADALRGNGSFATAKYTGKAFPNPEGICIYHKGADRVFKYTFDSNDKHKWEFDPEVDAPKTMSVLASLREKFSRRK